MAKGSDNPFPSVLLVEGTTPASPAAGNQRVFIDSADHKYKRVNSSGTVTTIEGSGSSSTGPLAYTAYNPGTLASYTTASTTIADVDATNLAVTFTVPASGKVLIRLEGVGGSGGAQSDNVSWGLRSGTTTVVSGLVASGHLSSGSSTANDSLSKTFYISGLTSGASLTYKWAWFVNTGTNTSRLFAGGTVGPAVMEVWAG